MSSVAHTRQLDAATFAGPHFFAQALLFTSLYVWMGIEIHLPYADLLQNAQECMRTEVQATKQGLMFHLTLEVHCHQVILVDTTYLVALLLSADENSLQT